MQCYYNSFIKVINFHGLFRNALRCRKTGACRILVPLRYLKRLGLGEKGVADLMVNHTIISDGKGKAEALNAQFTNVFTREDKSDVPSMGKSTIHDPGVVTLY